MNFLRSALDKTPPATLALRLTTIGMVLFGAQMKILKSLLTVLGFAGIAFPSWTLRARYWFIAASLSFVFHGFIWSEIDNHKYLFFYWLLACGFATQQPNPEESLAHNARLLIALSMGFAALWKLMGGQYLDGSFLHHTMLTDGRFVEFSNIVTGISLETLRENRVILRLWQSGMLDETAVQLTSNNLAQTISLALSYFTIAIEIFIALTFFLGDRIPLLWRHAGLMVFILTVYPVATVIGFGAMLIVMALADVPKHHYRIRLCYLGMLTFTLLAAIPKRLFDYVSRFLEILS